MTKLNILVTGCGGDIGQSIGKILNNFSFVENVYGIDICEKNAAKFIFKNFSLGIPCSNENYLFFLEEFISKHQINIVIPISEPELRLFCDLKNDSVIGQAHLLTSCLNSMIIGFDKYLTYEFLKQNELPFPITKRIEDTNRLESYPQIYKSRSGAGSKNVYLIENQLDFGYFRRKHSKSFIIQEFINDQQGEFTCGVYRSSSGIIRTIILKRELKGDQTGYAESVEHKNIQVLLVRIAEKLNLVGSINIQLRLKDDQPYVFEINPRFSSTVLFRELLGFRDVLWSIQDKLGLPLDEYFDTSIGKKIYKGFSEFVK